MSADHVISRFLVCDDRIVTSRGGGVLEPGVVHKHRANPLLCEEMPWEIRFDNLYPNAMAGPEGGYRLYYSPFVVDNGYTDTPPEQRKAVSYREVRTRLRESGTGWRRDLGVCLIESDDGLRWQRPRLGIVRWEERPSNLLMVGPHGAGILRDDRDADASRRYKLIANGGSGPDYPLVVAFSPDGVTWSDPVEVGDLARGDTHNNALWVPERNAYVAISRHYDGERIVVELESTDFLHWSERREVMRGTPERQIYSMPIFRWANGYLGLPAVFDTATDLVHTEVAFSTDTTHWQRIAPGRALIPTSGEPGDVDFGCVYASRPLVDPLNGEIRIYYGGSDGPHSNWRSGFLCLATLRPDGFVRYRAEPTSTARLRTAPIPVRPDTYIWLTADAEDGLIEVYAVDDVGRIRGKARMEGTVTEAPIPWPVTVTEGLTEVSLDIRLTDAALYSFGTARETDGD